MTYINLPNLNNLNLDFNIIVLKDHPIIGYRENGKDYVVKTIEIDIPCIEEQTKIANFYVIFICICI
jgi:restriction endonuclease S subunit